MNDFRAIVQDVTTPTQNQTTSQEPEATLSDLLMAGRRQFWPLVMSLIIGLVLGNAYFATSPKWYSSVAVVLVEDRIKNLSEEISTNLPLVRDDTALLNELQVLMSQELAEEVVRSTKLYEIPAFINPERSAVSLFVSGLSVRIRLMLPLEQKIALSAPNLSEDEEFGQKIQTVAAVLQNRIQIKRVGRSFSVSIGVTDQDPKLAAILANAYAESYLADQSTANRAASLRTAEWMQGRLDEIRLRVNQAAIEATEFKVRNGATDAQGLRELERRVETLNDLHQAISERYEQTIIEGSFPVTNGRILAYAMVPNAPVEPNLFQLLAIFALLGLLGGLAVSVLRERKEVFFRTGHDVERYSGLAFLGYLPVFRQSHLKMPTAADIDKTVHPANPGFVSVRRDASGVRSGNQIPAADAIKSSSYLPTVNEVPEYLMTLSDSNSVYMESLRNIHATFGLTTVGNTGGVIAVTSIIPGEGGTTLAANYANMLSKFGARTLLVDANVHRPTLSKTLGCSNLPGIIQVLEGSASLSDALRCMPTTGLDFLPCPIERGQEYPNDIFFRSGSSRIFSTMREYYDYIILDLPALGTAANTKAMLKTIDKVVLVEEWGKTPRNMVAQFLSREPDIARKTLGVVLNRVKIVKLSKYGETVRSGSHFVRPQRRTILSR